MSTSLLGSVDAGMFGEVEDFVYYRLKTKVFVIDSCLYQIILPLPMLFLARNALFV